MIKKSICLLLFFFFYNVNICYCHEVSGYLSIEEKVFLNDAIYDGQNQYDSTSLSSYGEYFYEWDDGSNITIAPFYRADFLDSKRTHFDIREMNYLYLAESWEIKVGISKVFWGVTESQHLVDIINQTDSLESLDGEEKLGQPMVYLSVPRDFGVFDVFVLPYFRERSFAGVKGRFRAAIPIDKKLSFYEHEDKQKHIDYAFRYSNTFGDIDIGLSYFSGTSREPLTVIGLNSEGDLILKPYYEIIKQYGLDIQYVIGDWLWKYETIFREGYNQDNYIAATGGFEYTYIRFFKDADLGMLMELLYDERGKNSTSSLDSDIMFGMRINLNDASSTEALFSIIQDVNSKGTVVNIESSRRIADNFKVSLESYFILASSQEETINAFRKDNYIQLECRYYF